MSNSLDDYNAPRNPLLDASAWHDVLSKKYPMLADALLGNELTRKDGPVRPPFTLMLREKNGSLSAMLSNQEASRTWFSPKLEPEELLASVETALREKLGEWVQKPKNGSGKKY